jgi:hypothetical protein
MHIYNKQILNTFVMASQVNISSNLLRGKVGCDPIQIKLYGKVDKKSMIAELKKLYPNASNEINNAFAGDITIKTVVNPSRTQYSYDVLLSK